MLMVCVLWLSGNKKKLSKKGRVFKTTAIRAQKEFRNRVITTDETWTFQ